MLGYLFIRVFMDGFRPLGELLFVILLYALTFVVVKLENARFNAPAVISLLSGLAVSFSTVISSKRAKSAAKVFSESLSVSLLRLFRA